MSRLFSASVRDNKRVINNYFLVTLQPLQAITRPKPGQFFMVSADDLLDPLLKRPFSLHRWLDGDFQILYRTVGKFTGMLQNKVPGDILNIIGPLGTSFPAGSRHRRHLLVAGGLGIAPVFAFAESLLGSARAAPGNEPPLLFYGAKTRRDLICLEQLKSIGIDPVISTEDGSAGEKGVITGVLKRYLRKCRSPGAQCTIYACGPMPMLRDLSVLVRQFSVKGYAALEQRMACGVGACMGCVVPTRKGFKPVCKEGPVFPIEEITWSAREES